MQPVLRGEVSRQCPDHLRAQVDDMVQAGLLRMARAHERGQTLTKAYVKKVAWSVTVDAVRKARRTADQPTPEGPAALQSVSAGRSPEDRAAVSELRAALRECLDALTRTSRDVLTLYLLGHTIRESATRLRLTPKQGESRIYKGLDTLRDCLRNKGHQP